MGFILPGSKELKEIGETMVDRAVDGAVENLVPALKTALFEALSGLKITITIEPKNPKEN